MSMGERAGNDIQWTGRHFSRSVPNVSVDHRNEEGGEPITFTGLGQGPASGDRVGLTSRFRRYEEDQRDSCTEKGCRPEW